MTLGKEAGAMSIDFHTSVKREAGRIASAVGLVEAPEVSRSEYWFARLAFRSPSTLIFFDCELGRDFGVDVLFGPIEQKDVRHSIHTYLRICEPESAAELGRCLPKDQREMDDLLRLFATALVKHRRAIFESPEETIALMERAFVDRDFANQPFRPTGRFTG